MKEERDALEDIAGSLRRRLDASRVTIRLGPDKNLPVLAESLGVGVASMRDESEIDQMAAETVRWVVREGRVLAVDDALAAAVPRTPVSMTDRFGLRAFMIAPVFVEADFTGTVSVHVNGSTREWTVNDLEAAAAAAVEVADLTAHQGWTTEQGV
jgi:GAF domain-containing protein